MNTIHNGWTRNSLNEMDNGQAEQDSSQDQPTSYSSLSGCYRPKARRPRTSFQEMQLNQLEDAFQKSHYPSDDVKKIIADQLSIPFDRVTVWFQNRRAKWRRDRRKCKVSYAVRVPTPPAALFPNYSQPNSQSGSYMLPPQPELVTSWSPYNPGSIGCDRGTTNTNQYHNHVQEDYHNQNGFNNQI